MDFSKMTVEEFAAYKETQNNSNTNKKSNYEIGKKYLIRTVTMITVGKLVDFNDENLIFNPSCWVADTGRFGECLKNGTVEEVEIYPNGNFVSRGSIVDGVEWEHDVPNETK